MVSGVGVCHLSAEKYHLPYALFCYSYIQIVNTILSPLQFAAIVL